MTENTSAAHRANEQEQTVNAASDLHDGEVEYEYELKFGIGHIIRVFIPVTVCMLVVTVIRINVQYFQKGNITPESASIFDERDFDESLTTDIAWSAIKKAAIILAGLIVMTVLLVMLFYFALYKIFIALLVFVVICITGLVFTKLFQAFLISFNIPFDWCTLAFIAWNNVCLALISLFCGGPLWVQQVYLVMISISVALTMLTFLPTWTIWALLGLVSTWDLFAVLCPKGPLRVLLELAAKRQQPIAPALVYSCGSVLYDPQMLKNALLRKKVLKIRRQELRDEIRPITETRGLLSTEDMQISHRAIGGAESKSRRLESDAKCATSQVQSDTKSTPNQGQTVQSTRDGGGDEKTSRISGKQEVLVQTGLKLGLGDLLFYSVLIGQVTGSGDLTQTIACYLVVVVGLGATLVLLAICQMALPALPISIIAGLLTNVIAAYTLAPFCRLVSIHQLNL